MIKPCPWCPAGTMAPNIYTWQTTDVSGKTLMWWYAKVQCENCKASRATGAPWKSEAEAVASATRLWNTRLECMARDGREAAVQGGPEVQQALGDVLKTLAMVPAASGTDLADFLRNIKDHEKGAIKTLCMLAVDDPLWDCTDFAKEAWWRAHQQTTDQVVALLRACLDGQDDGGGVFGHAELERLRRRLLDLKDDRGWRQAALDMQERLLQVCPGSTGAAELADQAVTKVKAFYGALKTLYRQAYTHGLTLHPDFEQVMKTTLEVLENESALS